MDDKRVEQLRGLLVFVMAWLVAVYVYQVAEEAFNGTVGVLVAIATVAVNWYARKKASAYAEDKTAFKFWLYLPMVVFLVVPFLVKMVAYLTGDGDRSWWTHVWALVPFLLTLGVPLAVLFWVYLCLGWIVTAPPDSDQAD